MTHTHHDAQYQHLLKTILDDGIIKGDRTGVGTKSVFGKMIGFDVSSHVPILTTKKIQLNSVIHELFWFISGSTNIKYLKDNGVNIWNDWADDDGELGPTYGKQWRDWDGLDQLQTVIDEIKTNPSSRRLIVSAWNAPLVWSGAIKLPPCHYTFQFIVEDNRLSLMWTQRSVDVFLGLPFNIASYTILLYMVAQITGLIPFRVICALGDTHIYLNHMDQVKEQLSRSQYRSPSLYLNKEIKEINDFKFDDIKVINYNHHPALSAPIAV